MAENPPVVYLLHGEDEYGITQFVAGIEAQMGDPSLAGMNTAKLDGRSASLEEIETAVSTLPFLAKRRLIIIVHPIARLTAKPARDRFLGLLNRASPAVAVALIEYKFLTDDRDRKNHKIHWLESWAVENPSRVFMKTFPLPRGEEMAKRIQQQAKAAGGQITPDAARELAGLVGDDPRSADTEVQKLLAYANYSRPIDVEDVHFLIEDRGAGDVFAMVDAIGNRNGKLAEDMLHRLLAEQDELSIFGMIVRQFRLLLLARELIDAGLQANAAKILRQHPYVMQKVLKQAVQFNLPVLETLFRRLLDIDTALKSGEMDGEVALDMLIAGTTYK